MLHSLKQHSVVTLGFVDKPRGPAAGKMGRQHGRKTTHGQSDHLHATGSGG